MSKKYIFILEIWTSKYPFPDYEIIAIPKKNILLEYETSHLGFLFIKSCM